MLRLFHLSVWCVIVPLVLSARFGEPVYTYSLKNGINDGFLTPFKVKQIQTTMDYYTFTSDDTVIEGEIEVGKVYDEVDFNTNIEIKEREKKRVEIFMNVIDPREKTLVFCATQAQRMVCPRHHQPDRDTQGSQRLPTSDH